MQGGGDPPLARSCWPSKHRHTRGAGPRRRGRLIPQPRSAPRLPEGRASGPGPPGGRANCRFTAPPVLCAVALCPDDHGREYIELGERPAELNVAARPAASGRGQQDLPGSGTSNPGQGMPCPRPEPRPHHSVTTNTREHDSTRNTPQQTGLTSSIQSQSAESATNLSKVAGEALCVVKFYAPITRHSAR
jgi:hypothetical protein